MFLSPGHALHDPMDIIAKQQHVLYRSFAIAVQALLWTSALPLLVSDVEYRSHINDFRFNNYSEAEPT